jgi:hypothetical protein
MRALFLLLVLANLVFYAYAHVTRDSGGVESQILLLQVAPEKINLTKAADKPVGKPMAGKPRAPGKSAPPKTALAAPAACLEWGIFAGPDVAKAADALARLDLAGEQVDRAVTDAGGYWVYMPPLKTKSEVDRKIRELNDLGVNELFVVQDAGQWRNAISLGIFRTDEAAQGFLAGLRKRGVRSAVAARRENFLKQVAFYVREPSESTVAKLTVLQQEFPGSEMKAAPCPPAAEPNG